MFIYHFKFRFKRDTQCKLFLDLVPILREERVYIFFGGGEGGGGGGGNGSTSQAMEYFVL